MTEAELMKNKDKIIESNLHKDMLIYRKQTNPLNFSEKFVQGLD